MKAALWHAMMLAWLGGLLLGARQAAPLPRNPAAASPQDPAVVAMWLIIGFTAWLLALKSGQQRFWTRRRHEKGRAARERPAPSAHPAARAKPTS
ncbi:MAG TPA: hypothetical protein VEX11_10815 [Acetobacteraceae bacterium]|nr:hypothetical protein [Acetobacteraceae bacterium]